MLLAQETNMAALGVGVLLLGGWAIGGIVLFRSGAKKRAAASGDDPTDPPD